MSLAIGYSGNVSMSPQVYQNPLNSVVPNNIVLTARETVAATRALGLPPWVTLNQQGKKMATAYALYQRGDYVSQQQSQQVLVGNPSFANVSVSLG